MEYTRFGEEMRVLRTRRHQSQKDMAEVLGVTKSFLSSVETGRRSIPKGWIDIIVDHYHLKPYPRQILEDAARASRNYIRIALKGQPNYRRNLAVGFEDSFEQIDEETSQMMLKLMGKDVSEDDGGGS
ncbi:MAG: helix-turn-helix domain-containing protein [Erysipelotrichaceae bacterium]|nr:helix-turn-helix domain-containing protein [Erysipelotrichaceae bacterium]